MGCHQGGPSDSQSFRADEFSGKKSKVAKSKLIAFEKPIDGPADPGQNDSH
jgi:hypothetical protein